MIAADIVLAKPPPRQEEQCHDRQRSGKTSKKSLIINRDDFWSSTSNPGVLALEITEDLEAALAQFAEIAADLNR